MNANVTQEYSMTAIAIEAALTVVEKLLTLIPQWINAAREKGELTAEQEAMFADRQRAVFAQPYARPSSTTPPTE